MVSEAEVQRILGIMLPGKKVIAVEDLGTWVRHNFRVTFRNDERAYVKFHVHSEWIDSTLHEKRTIEILRAKGLPAPEVLGVVTDLDVAGYPFIVVAEGRGTRLDRLIARMSEKDAAKLFFAIGEFYRKLHSIKAPTASGVWVDDPTQVIPTSPTKFMFENEIVGGSGAALVEKKVITALTHQRIMRVWEKSLPFLEDHDSVMVHGSTFPWTIYLEQVNRDWQVSQIGSLGDTLWWDAAYDLAFLLDPPFLWMFDEWRIAFENGYGEPINMRRVMLYRLLQILCAINDVYMQPHKPENESWKQLAEHQLMNIINPLEGQVG